ncbi:amino acid adenylation domain-containing protein [Amycolatopsis sp. NPDC088138]|uniref:amino acid adenylation domain-containing protein n=1 Tax=Amycolatopsis sp. NPDC088138 TaxID=3363938 RepID=UPI00380AC627
MRFLHDLLTVQAQERPHGTAAVHHGDSSTFGQVDTAATRVAAGLAARGVRPGERVGLHLDRSLNLLPALFGLLRAGAVCVPVDPDDPPARRSAILEFSQVGLVLTERALLGAPYPAGTRTVAVEDLLDDDTGHDRVDLPADALAFVFYTSGSTGVPKGVMLTHRALLSGQQWLQRRFPLPPGDRHLLRTTLSVTNLVREVFWPMLSGGTTVIVPPGEHKDPDRLVELITGAAVTTVMVVPALLSGMLDSPGFAANTSLRHVFCSSDAMPGELPEKYFATGLPARLYNIYGLTEALYGACWECLPGAAYEGFVPIGFPAELDPVVLDADLRPVADGRTGELCLSGAGIAEGYDRLPELTAAKFADTAAGRVFRTGDLSRRAGDGSFELLGRIDDQVKIAGYRVELGEVEARLKEVPGITGAVVSGRRGVGGHQRLVAHLTCADPPPSAAGIRGHLAGNLPEYMIPASFSVLDALPLTHNGKVDRRAIGELAGARLELAEDHTPPRTELEAELCRLWAEVLSLPGVGVHDNFLALGGDSIQGFMISARADRDGLGLTATQVFATPTVAELASRIEELRRTGAGRPAFVPAAFAVAPGDQAALDGGAHDLRGVQKVYPLTEMQTGMMFHSLLDPESAVYVEQFLFALDGELDPEAYGRAWQRVVDRHEILRVRIATEGPAEPVQVVQRHAEVEWTVLDWAGDTSDDQRAELVAYLSDDRQRGFAFERAPLFRLTLVRVGEARHRLVLSYHHLILDVWSLFLMLRDSLEFYRAERAGEAPALPPTRPFGDYVSFVGQQDTAPAREYWLDQLSGFNGPTAIGRAVQRGLSASGHDLHAAATFPMSEDLTERLIAYGRAHQLTLNSLVQAAWAAVIGGISGRNDVCFGMTVTHRPVALAGVEEMVGILVNILPMRLSLDADQPLEHWLRRVQRTQITARANDNYPLPLIQQNPGLPSGHPLFESLLIFENIPHGIGWDELGGVRVRHEENFGWTNYPFTAGVTAVGRLSFQVEYDLAYFDAESVNRVMTALSEVLGAISLATGTDSVGKLVGSVDRTPGWAAPAPAPALVRDGVEAAVPETAREAELAGVVAQVLGLDRVDARTPFLELGGSSLAALKVVALAKEKGFTIALRDLFGSEGTVRRLATG